MQLVPPPHSLEAEEHVVGACLSGNDKAVAAVAETLEHTHFYRRSLGTIYDACIKAVQNGAQPDPVTVADVLRQQGELDDVGGPAKLVELAATMPTVGNLPHYAAIVRDYAYSREQLAVSQALAKVATNGGLANHPDVQQRLQDLVQPAHFGEPLELLDLDEALSGPVPVIEWCWEGWIGSHDLALIVGDPGVGKSWMTLSLAMAMLRGDGFLNDTTAQRPVGIIDLENSVQDVLVRLHALGVRPGETQGLHYMHMPHLNLTNPFAARMLHTTIERYELGFLVLDSFRALCPGVDENDSAAVSAILRPLSEIAHRRRMSIALIHHAKKAPDGVRLDAAAAARGTGEFMAAVDVELFLRKKTGESNTFTLEHGKNRHAKDHDIIQVTIESDTNGTRLVSQGDVVRADDQVERIADRVVSHLEMNDYGATRAELAEVAGAHASSREFRTGLKLAAQRGLVVEHKRASGAASVFVHIQHDQPLEPQPDPEDFPF